MTKKLAFVLLAGTVLLLLNGYARAEVRDNAGLFNDDTVRQANEHIGKLGVPVVVETYAALPNAMLQSYGARRERTSRSRRSTSQRVRGRPGRVRARDDESELRGRHRRHEERHSRRGREHDGNATRWCSRSAQKKFDEGLLRGLDALSTSTGLRTRPPAPRSKDRRSAQERKSSSGSSPRPAPTDAPAAPAAGHR